jgi:hypothetical protein
MLILLSRRFSRFVVHSSVTCYGYYRRELLPSITVWLYEVSAGPVNLSLANGWRETVGGKHFCRTYLQAHTDTHARTYTYAHTRTATWTWAHTHTHTAYLSLRSKCLIVSLMSSVISGSMELRLRTCARTRTHTKYTSRQTVSICMHAMLRSQSLLRAKLFLRCNMTSIRPLLLVLLT